MLANQIGVPPEVWIWPSVAKYGMTFEDATQPEIVRDIPLPRVTITWHQPYADPVTSPVELTLQILEPEIGFVGFTIEYLGFMSLVTGVVVPSALTILGVSWIVSPLGEITHSTGLSVNCAGVGFGLREAALSATTVIPNV